LAGFRVERVLVVDDAVHLEARRLAATAACPTCGRRSSRIHSRYTRRIADEPVGGRRLVIRFRARRFRCPVATCPRRTFAEQAPALAARYARRSVPLQGLLEDIGLTVGGRPGARFARRRAIAASRTTLLRLVRALPEPATTPPAVLGIDDFALRRGHRYGTVLVDLEARSVVDLLPERTAEALVSWLSERARPRLICRDRGGEYASGARRGAPGATQIADRFHLACNSSEVLERVLVRHPAALRAAVAEDAGAAASGPATPVYAAQPVSARTDPRRARRLARYEAVVALREQGWSITAIGEQVGLSRPTVRKYLQAGAFPEWPARRTALSAGTPHAEHLRRRWMDGCHDATTLWQELRGRGFRGSLRTVQRAVAGWGARPRRRGRAAKLPRPPDTVAPPPARPPSARHAVWLLLPPVDQLTPTQQAMRRRLLAAAPAVEAALTLIDTFRRLIRERDGAALEPWLQAAEASPVPELRTFAAGLRRDHPAVAAALAHPWSSGQVEGQVTRIKLIKRQMFGRAKFDLLRKRVLLAS